MDKLSLFFDKSIIFKQIPIFAGLNFFEKRLILNSLEITELNKSEMIYRQGDPPSAFYCIITGRVQIFIDKNGQEETLEHIHRGKYFGFISLLTGESHSVSARAVNDTVLAKISRENFNVILKSIPRLAIDLSQMLSRRLKRKDLHPKSIFESTIIAVFGDELRVLDNALYSLNLSLGLKNETTKKVILVDTDSNNSLIAGALGKDSSSGFMAAQPFFSTEEVYKHIVSLKQGIDILRIFVPPKKTLNASFLISLLTMLANDYHFCVVHLAFMLGPDVFKILAQCDAVHLLIPSDLKVLKSMSTMMQEAGIWADPEIKKKIKLIILEDGSTHGKGVGLSHDQESALFHQPIFATLPAVGKGSDDSYTKVLRRISRQTGEVLVGLALGSGSAMGMAHIGVLKVFEREGIPVDIVSGSSIGAFIGALWCAGYTADEVEEIILNNKNTKYLFGWDDFTIPFHGLLKGNHIRQFLNRYLKDMTFYDIKRPFKVVACDCMNMKPVVFDSGKLVDAVLASVSIPGVFEPHKIGGRFYIDGGILNPLPTNVLVESGARKIISVNVLPSADEIERTYEILKTQELEKEKKQKGVSRLLCFCKNKISKALSPSIFDIIVSNVQSSEYLLAQMSSLSQSDLTLHPDMSGVSWSAFENAPDIIRRGEEITRLHLKEIKELINQPD